MLTPDLEREIRERLEGSSIEPAWQLFPAGNVRALLAALDEARDGLHEVGLALLRAGGKEGDLLVDLVNALAKERDEAREQIRVTDGTIEAALGSLDPPAKPWWYAHNADTDWQAVLIEATNQLAGEARGELAEQVRPEGTLDRDGSTPSPASPEPCPTCGGRRFVDNKPDWPLLGPLTKPCPEGCADG